MASLRRCLNTALGEDFKEFTSVYVDDLLVHSDTIEAHLIHLDKIFVTLGRAGLTVKLRKSQFLRHEVSFLGHIISADGVSIDKTRIECINKFPTPRNLRELRGFLGFVNYEQRFCKNYADLTLPLLKLLKKGQKWKWGPEEEEAMRAIKDAYLKTVLIVHPDLNRTFYIQCDSSDYALGGSLYQLSNEGERQVVAYTSSTFKGSQLTYTTTEKEALAVIHCLRQWRNLILGRDLVILSDHKSLSFLLTCKLRSARLSRWIMFIKEFDFRIEHCKGSENTIADVLSRFPLRKTSFAKPEVGINVNIALMKLSNDFSMLKKHFKVLRTDQMNDEWIRNKIEFIENCQEGVEFTNEKDRNILRWFVVHEGILFKRGDVRCPGFKLCVPQNQRRDIILAHHKALGHFGKTKTYLHMRNMFYWPKILKHVRQIVAACDLCQKGKCSPKSRGLLNPIITKKPGELVCLDMIGPLPQGRGGVTQILVIVDAFSKFVKLYALRRATSKAILNKIVKDNTECSKTECILSDNATQFTKFVEGCLNNIINLTTGFTPSYVQTGVVQPNPIDKYVKYPEVIERNLPLESVWELACTNLKSKATLRADKANEKIKPVEFEIGTQVLVRTHYQSSAEERTIKKSFLLYKGPFYILRRAGPNSYVVGDEKGVELSTENIINLKAYKVLLNAPPPKENDGEKRTERRTKVSHHREQTRLPISRNVVREEAIQQRKRPREIHATPGFPSLPTKINGDTYKVNQLKEFDNDSAMKPRKLISHSAPGTPEDSYLLDEDKASSSMDSSQPNVRQGKGKKKLTRTISVSGDESERATRYQQRVMKSLVPHLGELKECLCDKDPDIICLTRTWLSNSVPDEQLSLKQYSLFRSDRPDKGEGVAMYVKSKIISAKINDVITISDTEQLWVKINVNDTSTAIGVIYRPPKQKVNIFLNEFEDSIGHIFATHDQLICSGDYNIDLSRIQSPASCLLNNVLNSFGLIQLVETHSNNNLP
ncbi:hypothetical protein JTB14_022799 [Gonioctena quinquepunctata]|nr:hypothetical protein JTB14_022799 [Gonioctena quinquepunctata]